MAKAIKTGKFYNFNKTNYADGLAKITCNDGLCAIDSNVEIMGIEIHFTGKVQITPDLPDNWIMQGNQNKLLIFTLQNAPLQKHSLFNYIGEINIVKSVIANKNGLKINYFIEDSKSNWLTESLNFDINTSQWKDIKDFRKKVEVKKTSYNLPDYDLPKVNKKQLKQIRRRATTTAPTYTTGGGSTSGSGGSGGY